MPRGNISLAKCLGHGETATAKYLGYEVDSYWEILFRAVNSRLIAICGNISLAKDLSHETDGYWEILFWSAIGISETS